MKKTTIRLCFLLLFGNCFCFAQDVVTAKDIIEKIKSSVTLPWNEEGVDRVIAGNENVVITGVAVTFMSTLDVLKKAKAAGCNMIITHEPTFYNGQDNMNLHSGDPVQEAKLKYILDNNMVIWRFHDHQHRTLPDQIYEGVSQQMGWDKYKREGAVSFDMPETTLGDFVAQMRKKSGAMTMRVIGDKNQKIKRVGLSLGAAGSQQHFAKMKDTQCDVLIIGESNEWETVPYIQDARSLGLNKALIVVGHADSEEAGMIYFKKWLQGFYLALKIEFIKAGNPFWIAK